MSKEDLIYQERVTDEVKQTREKTEQKSQRRAGLVTAFVRHYVTCTDSMMGSVKKKSQDRERMLTSYVGSF